MKLLIEIRKEDTMGNLFSNCGDCAVARAVKRVIKKSVLISEAIDNTRMYFKNDIDNYVRVSHEYFGFLEFRALKESPNGTFHVLEMDIPEKFLKSHELAEVKQCA